MLALLFWPRHRLVSMPAQALPVKITVYGARSSFKSVEIETLLMNEIGYNRLFQISVVSCMCEAPDSDSILDATSAALSLASFCGERRASFAGTHSTGLIAERSYSAMRLPLPLAQALPDTGFAGAYRCICAPPVCPQIR